MGKALKTRNGTTLIGLHGITLIHGKELIVKICSHVIIFSHGTKLVAVCEILFTRWICICLSKVRYKIMISSYRDKMNIQIVNFFGINRVMTHNSSQSLPVDWGWDIVSFTNSMEPWNSSKSERMTQRFKSVHLHASCRNGLSRPTRKELLILQAVNIEQVHL